MNDKINQANELFTRAAERDTDATIADLEQQAGRLRMMLDILNEKIERAKGETGRQRADQVVLAAGSLASDADVLIRTAYDIREKATSARGTFEILAGFKSANA